MEMHCRIYWLHALTPLHAGAGRGVGFIDLPIAREKVTNWPLVPGSTVKGVLADHFGADQKTRETNKMLAAAFGRVGEDQSNSGALVFTDARLVCLPVRSLKGTFAWVSSPMSLLRLKRDLDSVGFFIHVNVPQVADEVALVPQGAKCAIKTDDDKVYLEDLDFSARGGEASVGSWASTIAKWVFPSDQSWQQEFQKRFAVLPDESFNFLCETGTEVDARVRIDEQRKSVVRGALWYEESLPAETLLAGIVWCDRVFSGNGATPEKLLEEYCTDGLSLQIGGKATVGRGRVRCIFAKE